MKTIEEYEKEIRFLKEEMDRKDKIITAIKCLVHYEGKICLDKLKDCMSSSECAKQ